MKRRPHVSSDNSVSFFEIATRAKREVAGAGDHESPGRAGVNFNGTKMSRRSRPIWVLRALRR